MPDNLSAVEFDPVSLQNVEQKPIKPINEEALKREASEAEQAFYIALAIFAALAIAGLMLAIAPGMFGITANLAASIGISWPTLGAIVGIPVVATILGAFGYAVKKKNQMNKTNAIVNAIDETRNAEAQTMLTNSKIQKDAAVMKADINTEKSTHIKNAAVSQAEHAAKATTIGHQDYVDSLYENKINKIAENLTGNIVDPNAKETYKIALIALLTEEYKTQSRTQNDYEKIIINLKSEASRAIQNKNGTFYNRLRDIIDKNTQIQKDSQNPYNNFSLQNIHKGDVLTNVSQSNLTNIQKV